MRRNACAADSVKYENNSGIAKRNTKKKNWRRFLSAT